MNDQQSSRININGKAAQDTPGHLFIISGPSGSGKTTFCQAALDRLKDMLYSVSHTTRKPRKGEQEGIDYYFISKSAFERKIRNGKWAEWAQVHGNYYGTSTEFLEKRLAAGKDILLDIDVQGTIELLKHYPDSVTIFIVPQSHDTLRSRLESRDTDSKEEIERRLMTSKKEMEKIDIYRHVIINDHLPLAIERLISIIEGYRSRKNAET